MSDIKELIDKIMYAVNEDSENGITHIFTDTLTEVVELLEKYTRPTDELVKEILWINKNFGGSPNAKHKIHKLLKEPK